MDQPQSQAHEYDYKTLKYVLKGVFFALGVYIMFMLGPWMETRFFPVVKTLHILRTEATDGGASSLVWGYFEKVRDCEYVGIAWFRGSRLGNFDRVSFVPVREIGDHSSPTRPLGTQQGGPWKIGLPIEDLETNSFVEIFHSCHPFWVTRTQWYP